MAEILTKLYAKERKQIFGEGAIDGADWTRLAPDDTKLRAKSCFVREDF